MIYHRKRKGRSLHNRGCDQSLIRKYILMNGNPWFSVFFCCKTLKEVWVKMWVNRLTHTVTHTGKCSERAKDERTEKPLF